MCVRALTAEAEAGTRLLANLVQTESRQFAAQNPETERLIEGALQAGQQAQAQAPQAMQTSRPPQA